MKFKSFTAQIRLRREEAFCVAKRTSARLMLAIREPQSLFFALRTPNADNGFASFMHFICRQATKESAKLSSRQAIKKDRHKSCLFLLAEKRRLSRNASHSVELLSLANQASQSVDCLHSWTTATP